MDHLILAKILRAMRMTQNLSESTQGQIIACVNRVNALMTAEGIEWPDLLGGDPDSPSFPVAPIWHSSTGLSPDEMQAVFDTGYRRGLADGKAEKRMEDNAEMLDQLDEFLKESKLEPLWTSAELADLIRLAAASLPLLSEWEQTFTDSWLAKLNSYRRLPKLSPKQTHAWQRIEQRLKKHGLTI